MSEPTTPPTGSEGSDETREGPAGPRIALPVAPFELSRYSARALLGRGGFGAVYLARDRELERDVALKLLERDPRSGSTPEEGRIVARFNHPHIVTLHDVGTWRDHPFLVMEHMAGGSLAARLSSAGALSPEEGRRLLYQTALGLQAAHARGVVHRDIKPGNLLLNLGGVLKVGDFGIADAGGALRAGRAARLPAGTLPYLAPELFRPGGAPSSLEAGVAQDLYALGVTAYEILTGRRPVDGTVARLIAWHERDRVTLGPLTERGTPPALVALIRRLLSKHPADRPGDMAEVVEILRDRRAPSPGLAVARPAVAGGVLEPFERVDARDTVDSLEPLRARQRERLGALAGFFLRAGGKGRVAEIFVEVGLTPHPSSVGVFEGSSESAQRGETSALHPGAEVRLEQVLEDPHRRWVLLGDPGSGKTTLLHDVSLRLLDDPTRVPLFFKLSELEGAWGLKEAVAAIYGEASVAPVLTAAKDERLILFLDGLDEALSPKAARGAIRNLCRAVGTSPVIVTSRYTGYQDSPLRNGFRELALRPLRREQQEALLTGWGVDRSAAQATIGQMESQVRLRAMAENPLLLTLVALLLKAQPDRPLPSRRGELYRLAIELLLKRSFSPNLAEGDEPEGARRLRCPDLALDALAAIALELHGMEGEVYPTAEIQRALNKNQETEVRVQREWGSLDVFLSDVSTCSGILIPEFGPLQVMESWRFPHRTFREFLAARALTRDIYWRGGRAVDGGTPAGDLHELQPTSESLKKVLENGIAHPASWSEVLALTCGLMDSNSADILVRQVALSGNLELVVRIVAEAENIREDTVWSVVGMEKGGERWEQRKKILAQLPSLVQNGSAVIRLVDRFLRQTTNGNDLYFTRELLHRLKAGEADDELGEALSERDRAKAQALARDIFRYLDRGRKEKALAMLKHQWIPIEGGSFKMGSEDISADEEPVHWVALSPYRFQMFQITNEIYQMFDPEHRVEIRFSKQGKELSHLDRHPVVNVTWYEACMFAEWAGASLPSEAQWEYAARGPSGSSYPWGAEIPTARRANFAAMTKRTTPVGSFPAGASWCGAEDLAGNVWEWCKDWYGTYNVTQKHDPIGPSTGICKVLRGGSHGNSGDRLRGAFRGGILPEGRIDHIGFRLVTVTELATTGLPPPLLTPSLLPNPFSFSGMVSVPHPFIGRRALLSRLERSISKGESHLLLGELWVGKSSVLKQLATVTLRGHPTLIPVYVDLHRIRTPDIVGWLNLTVGAIVSADPNVRQRLHRAHTPSLREFQSLCESLSLQGRTLLLLMDGEERLSSPSLGFTDTLLKLIRSLISRRLVSVVIACNRSPADRQLMPDGTSPWSNVFRTTLLRPFTGSEASSFLDLGGTIIGPEERELVLTSVGRFPGLLRAACFTIFDDLLAGRRDPKVLLEALRREIGTVLLRLWNHQTEDDRRGLAQIAGVLQGTPTERSIKHLLRRGIIESHDDELSLFSSLFGETVRKGWGE